MVVTVELNNEGPREVHIPRFDARTLTFYCAKAGTGVRVVHEPVEAVGTEPVRHDVGPGQPVVRRFLFTRTTLEEGDHALLVSFKGAFAGETLVEQTAFAEPVQFRVEQPIVLERDPASGLMRKREAIRLAARAAAGPVAEQRAVLVPLGSTGLYVWVVWVRLKESPAGEAVFQVNPYTGRTEPLEIGNQEAPAQGSAEAGGDAMPTPEASVGEPAPAQQSAIPAGK